MTLFITYLRQKFILVFLFGFLFGFASAKDNTTFKYTSIPESTTITSLDIATEGEISFRNDGILTISNENEKILYSTKEKVSYGTKVNIKLQSSKKIVFKPGTKIEPKEGERLIASITDPDLEEDRSIIKIAPDLYELFNEEKNVKSSFNKNKDDRGVLFSSIADGLIVNNQQRRLGNIKYFTQQFSVNIILTKYYYLQITSRFTPETVKVLRL
jgi:hypothetical protein